MKNEKWGQPEWSYTKTKTEVMVDCSIKNQFEYKQLEKLTDRIHSELKMMEQLLNMIDYNEPNATDFLRRIQQRSLRLQRSLEAYTDLEMILIKQRAVKELL